MDYTTQASAKFRALRDKESITILAIESSCDETACAITRGREVLANVISTQIDIHKLYGGVVPEIASRQHTLAIDSVVHQAFAQANMTVTDIDAVAVTYGAGLLGALLIGVSYAKAFAYANGLPLVAVNHIQGHIAAGYIAHPELVPPYIALVVSGGHTAILDVDDYTSFTVLGRTTDDACGEAFDKVARVLGLPYPGGPNVERLAAEGEVTIRFPRPFAGSEHLNFSYSGLKTAVINHVHGLKQKDEEINAADIAASFQFAALDMLIDNAVKAAKHKGLDTISVVGGVSANGYFRKKCADVAPNLKIRFLFPPKVLSTDNAAMIGAHAYYMIKAGKGLAGLELDANAALKMHEYYSSEK